PVGGRRGGRWGAGARAGGGGGGGGGRGGGAACCTPIWPRGEVPRAPQNPGRLRRALHLLRDDDRAGRESLALDSGAGRRGPSSCGAARGDRADGRAYRDVG